jgi:hypothetical protein
MFYNEVKKEVFYMQTENLVRKQFLITPGQARKLELLAKQQRRSAAQVVRDAIDAYNPDVPADMKESDLLELVSAKVKEALADTIETRIRLRKTLTQLGLEGE